MVVAAAIVAGVFGMARANGSDMSPSTPTTESQIPDTSPLTWRQSHPNGRSVREMQSLWGSWAGQYHLGQPLFTSAAADTLFRESHPNGLSDRELQAMASETPAWKMPKQTVFG